MVAENGELVQVEEVFLDCEAQTAAATTPVGQDPRYKPEEDMRPFKKREAEAWCLLMLTLCHITPCCRDRLQAMPTRTRPRSPWPRQHVQLEQCTCSILACTEHAMQETVFEEEADLEAARKAAQPSP